MNNKEKFKEIINKKWYIQGFNACLNFAFPAPHSGLLGCYKNLGYGYTEKVFIFNKDYLEYLYLEEDFVNIGNEFLKRFKKNKDYIHEVIQKDHNLVNQTKAVEEKIDQTEFNDLSKEELVILYQEMWQGYHFLMDVSHIIEGISFVVEPLLKEKLEKALNLDRHDKEFREIFNNLLQPAKASFAGFEHLAILEILKEIKDNKEALELFTKKKPQDILKKLSKEILAKITDHKKQFRYNQVNYYYGDSLTELDYITELKKIIKEDVDDKIKEEKERYEQNNKKREEVLNEYNFDQEIIDLVTLSIEVLHWQDERKKNLLVGVYYMNRMLKQLGKRFEIPLEMLKRYTGDELVLEILGNFDFKEAEERMKEYVVYTKRENEGMVTEIYLGKEYNEFMDIYHKSFSEKNDIHGTCASAGITSGIVRICKTKEDLKGFKDGEVLISSKTRPEYVPAMKKAIAIVTDEGGLTCHAAIIARELGKPCIVGTKLATKVFKDGDLVEINAGHGTVKIVK